MNITGNPYIDDDIWRMVHQMKMHEVIAGLKRIFTTSIILKSRRAVHAGCPSYSVPQMKPLRRSGKRGHKKNSVTNILYAMVMRYRNERYRELEQYGLAMRIWWYDDYNSEYIKSQSMQVEDDIDDVSGGYVDMGKGFSNIKGYQYL